MARPAAFGPRDIYRSFRAERNDSAHRVLRRLPDEFIELNSEGLAHAVGEPFPSPRSARVVDEQFGVAAVRGAFAAWATPAGAPA